MTPDLDAIEATIAACVKDERLDDEDNQSANVFTLAFCANDLVAALREAWAEAERLRAALTTIRQWDCLNPPDPNLLADLPWLARLIDAALEGETP